MSDKANVYTYPTEYGTLEFTFHQPHEKPEVSIYARDGLTINGVDYRFSLWAFLEGVPDDRYYGTRHCVLGDTGWIMGEYDDRDKGFRPKYTMELGKAYKYNVNGRWDSSPTDSARSKAWAAVVKTLGTVLAEHPEATKAGRFVSLLYENGKLLDEYKVLVKREQEIKDRLEEISDEMHQMTGGVRHG